MKMLRNTFKKVFSSLHFRLSNCPRKNAIFPPSSHCCSLHHRGPFEETKFWFWSNILIWSSLNHLCSSQSIRGELSKRKGDLLAVIGVQAGEGSTLNHIEKFTAPQCFKNLTPQAFSKNTTRVFPKRNRKIFFSLWPNIYFYFIIIFGLSGWLSGKALTFHQTGPKFNSRWCLVSGQMATLVGRVATPVIPASGTQPVDQGWGKNYGVAKG